MQHTMVFLDVEEADQPKVLKRYPNATFLEANLSGDDLVDACKNAQIISTFITTAFPREVIEKLPKLKLLCTRSVGYDHIDVATCAEKGIMVCNVPDYGSHVIAEHVFALLLSTIRHILAGDARVQSGVFEYRGLRGMALKGKTIGILGTGKIGQKVAHIAHGFEMKILATDICRVLELEEKFGVEYVPLEELLAQSDIITVHVPAMKATEHMLNAKAFARMKDGVVLVNTARGSIIDSSALYDALESGKVKHALLDVMEHEHNFEENKKLIGHPHVVTTPHIAFYADDSVAKMYADCFQSIDEWQRGERPQHSVHPVEVVCDLPPARK